MGVHLRAESDAFGWNPYEQQATAYLTKAAARNISVLFVACGDPAIVSRFKADAAAKYEFIAVSKWDLLSKAESDKITGLWFDQLAVIDAAVMKSATYFMGIGLSSFPQMVLRERDWMGRESEILEPYAEYNVCCW